MVFVFLTGMAILFGFPVSNAYAQEIGVDREAPVDFVADSLEHDETGQIITARGNVELVQSGRILRADTVSYNLGTDTVRAQGNVVLNEPNGDTYFANEVELTDKMKDGFVHGLRGLLADGSRFTAEEGQRIAGTTIVLEDASYTPCEPCKKDPSKPPVWQLVAGEVTHDKENATISYRDARFEVAGVPVAYTPYFSHADGSVERKSGLLTPSVGFDSELGGTYEQQYYWDIAPDKDATFGAMVSTEEAPLLLGEYRQRFAKAGVDVSGGVTYSKRQDSVAGVKREQDEEVRGHIFGNAEYDINENWRTGVNVEAASDDQYMRQYDISNEDVLENEVYVERFKERNYAVARMMAFQDVRVSRRQEDQPMILPEVTASFVGDPNGTLGGRWSAEVSALGLERQGDDQDLSRGSAELGWQRRFVSNVGLVTTFDATARGDAYNVRDREVAFQGSGRSREASSARGFAQANLKTGYPIAKNFGSVQAVVEPLASVTAGTNVNVSDDVPNEDSQDIFIDSSKLFEPNRFPGYDRIEDKSRVTYGLRTGLHGADGKRGEVFFGQSYRLDNDDNPFPEGSGLSEQESDYVGQVSAYLGPLLSLDYRFQLENTGFESRRHEVDMQSRMGPLVVGTRYFYAGALGGTDFNESREQIRPSARLQLSDQWEVFGSTQYDLGENEGLRRARYGVDYLGQCVDLSLVGERNLTRESSGDSGTEIMLRVGLKNLGEFETSGLSVGGSDE